jgi:hypothetical protein
MKAPGTLSPQQKSALESVYAFLSGATSFLEFIERKLPANEKPVGFYDASATRNLRDWADLCQHRLIEAFPELLSWVEEWKRGGA